MNNYNKFYLIVLQVQKMGIFNKMKKRVQILINKYFNQIHKFKKKKKKNQTLNNMKNKIIKVIILQNQDKIQKLKMKIKQTIKNFLKISDLNKIINIK